MHSNAARNAAICLALALASPVPATAARDDERAGTPRVVADSLLAADRAFAAASATTDLVRGLSAQFAEDVVMPVPGKGFAEGRRAAIEALAANADQASARIEWTPARVGISADGRHGFTLGTMRMLKADRSVVPLKYLAYWVRGTDGWRVAAYRRVRRPATSIEPLPMMPPALPARLVDAVADPATRTHDAQSLAQAERAFSDEAQAIGLATAFARHGRADAVNMGGPDEAGFVVGAEAIGRAVAVGEPASGSSVSWSADRVIVADSGDLGVTIGMIRRNTPPADAKAAAAFPFFTIWRRATPDQPWRYIAE